MSSSDDDAPEQLSHTSARTQKNTERKQLRAFEDAERAKKSQKRALAAAAKDERPSKRAKVAHVEEESGSEDEDGKVEVDDAVVARMERAMKDAQDEDSDLDVEGDQEGGDNSEVDDGSQQDQEDEEEDEEDEQDEQEDENEDLEDADSSGESTDADLDPASEDDQDDEALSAAAKYLPEHLFQSALASAKPFALLNTSKSNLSRSAKNRLKKKEKRRLHAGATPIGCVSSAFILLCCSPQCDDAARTAASLPFFSRKRK